MVDGDSMEYRPNRERQKQQRKHKAKQFIEANLLGIIVALVVGGIIIAVLMLTGA